MKSVHPFFPEIEDKSPSNNFKNVPAFLHHPQRQTPSHFPAVLKDEEHLSAAPPVLSSNETSSSSVQSSMDSELRPSSDHHRQDEDLTGSPTAGTVSFEEEEGEQDVSSISAHCSASLDVANPDQNSFETDATPSMEEEIRKVQCQIRDIRRRRTALRLNGMEPIRQKRALLVHRLNSTELVRDDVMASLESTLTRAVNISSALKAARDLDATSDCFHIWHRGPYGTINGLRLGTDAATIPSADTTEANNERLRNGANSNNNTASASTFASIIAGSYSFFSSTPNSPSTNDSAVDHDPNDDFAAIHTDLHHQAVSSALPMDVSKVPWSEINGALGMTALLLLTLHDRPNSGIVFRTHDILPMGHQTKIAELKKKRTASDAGPAVHKAVYDLFYDGGAGGVGGGLNMLLFGRSNFNAALHGLACCLADAADCIRSLDGAAIIPHDVVRAGSRQQDNDAKPSSATETMIGGIPVAYKGDGEKWSRAMKYLLSDLKWLSAFVAKRTIR